MTTDDEQFKQKIQGLLDLGIGSTPYRKQAGRRYEFSFVWLKPFVKIHSRRVSEYQPLMNADLRNPDGLPFEELERLCLDEGTIVSWWKTAEDCGFSGIAEVAIAIASGWGAFLKPHIRRDLAARLKEYMLENNIVEPSDNGFSAFEIRTLHGLLADAGFTDIVHFDDSLGPCDDRHQSYSLTNQADPLDVWGYRRASDTELSFYVQTYFNDFTFVLHGPKALSDAIRSNRNIEGFFCTPKTSGDWFFDTKNEQGETKLIPSDQRVIS